MKTKKESYFRIALALFFTLIIFQLTGVPQEMLNMSERCCHTILLPKLQTTINVTICMEKDGKKVCGDTEGIGSGSGTIIKQENNKTYVLTAGHVCDSSDQVRFWESRGAKATVSSVIIDFKGRRYPVMRNVIINHDYDLCVVEVWGTFGKTSAIGRIAPRIGDKVFNIAAPQGDSAPGMAAILEGRYSGLFQFKGTTPRSAYTIPAIGGSSGSGVFNANGQLIGMIHSVRRNFHHLSYGPTHDELMHFLKVFRNTLAQETNVEVTYD